MARGMGAGIGRMSLRRLGGGGGAAYTPATDSTFRLFYPVESLANGAVASWPELRASKTATQASGPLQPTKSATSLGGFPGITSDGGDVLVATGAGAAISDLSAITIFVPMLDASAALRVAFELTADATTFNGGFFCAPNNNSATRMSFGASGTVGNSSKWATNGLASVVMVTCGIDISIAGAGAIVWMEFDGVDQSMTTLTSASASGLFASSDLHFFGRNPTPTLPWPGTMGAFGVRVGTTRDAGYDQALTWWGATCGKVL